MKQPEFIVGKWYKTSYEEDGEWYFKILRVANNGDVFADYQIKINSNQKLVTQVQTFAFIQSKYKYKLFNTREATLEEIQQYLPDNHPDKIKINMEKQTQAKPFAIFGSKPLLKAIWEDLLFVGYVDNPCEYNPENNYENLEYICTNYTMTPETIEEFKMLYAGNISSKRTLAQSCEIFELPAQYNDALEFAKKQLSSVYWKKEFKFKIGDYITSNDPAYKNHIGRITKLYTNNIGNPIYNYWGFKPDGEFKEDDDNYCVICPDDRLATDEEIKLFLKRATKFKGYTDGCKIDQKTGYKGAGATHKVTDTSKIEVSFIKSNKENYYNVSISGTGVFSDADNNNDWAKVLPNTLPFGNLEFTIHKEKQFAKCDMGVITKEEIQSVITYWNTDIKLLGYSMEICLNKRPIPKPEWSLKFGCCEGTIEQAKTILKAFD